MPAYFSHSIMAEDVFKKGMICQTEINVDELKTYSLGADLATLSKSLKSSPHLTNTRDFFLYMITYIKNHKLMDNPHVMALLYGHVMHYFFDVNAHPFIFYLDYNCEPIGAISNHRLIEGYLDSYLIKKILNKDIMSLNHHFFNKADLNNIEIKKILDETYYKIYGAQKINKTYHRTVELFSLIERTCKCGLFSKEFLISFSKFDKFMDINKLLYSDLSNELHNEYLNPFNLEGDRKSFLDMYYLSIYESLSAIEEINNYLYHDKDKSILYSVFTNLSYATGLDCSLGKKSKIIKKC